MLTLLSIVLFAMQGVADQQAKNGVVSGMVRDAAGRPQVGVRVAAMAARETDSRGDVLVSIARTDATGAYVLEVPVGSYYVIAGQVDRPLYYPAAANADRATVFSITAGSSIRNVDFLISALEGVVRDVSGKPQAGVRVRARDVRASAANSCRGIATSESVTDENGTYRLDASPGEYYVVARLLDRTTYYPAAAFREGSRTVTITPGFSVDAVNITVPNEDLSGDVATSDRDLYAHAVENLRLDCYGAARLQLDVLVKTFPKSQHLPDAKYLFAESFYREGTAPAMIEAGKLFTDFIALFPESVRTPEARIGSLIFRRDRTIELEVSGLGPSHKCGGGR